MTQYQVQQSIPQFGTVKGIDGADKPVAQILHTGSYDECKLYLVENYGKMPVAEFLAHDITIEAKG